MIRLGLPIHLFDTISSTMDEIDRLARTGASEGTAVVAGLQEQGRGRAGRNWIASPNSAFLCSVLLRPNLRARDISSLPLIAGVAIAEAIEQVSGLHSQLKWPNDVFLNGKKICGVLMQSRSIGENVEFINLGFGVNVNSPVTELPLTATSIAIETGRKSDLAEFEALVFTRLSTRYSEFCENQGRPSLQPWVDRALFLGDEVEIEQPGGMLHGKFTGISHSGALQLETESGALSIAIGELTRGPQPSIGSTH